MVRSTQVLPTKETIFNSIQQNIVRRNKQVYYFASALNDVEGPYSFAVNAPWGEGKTFFVKQTKMLIDACNPFTASLSKNEKKKIKATFQDEMQEDNAASCLQPQMTVYYDAWLCDNDNDPILSLLYEIALQSAQYFEYDLKEERNKFLKAMSFCASIADLVFGINTGGIVSAIEQLATKEDELKEIVKQKDIQKRIKDFLSELMVERGNRLIIFVDELDRCKPDYAVRFLERIKHYFIIDNITFVFSVNIKELRHTINRFYGEGLNSTLYLTRFFDYVIDLPTVELRNYYSEIGLKTMNYFEIVCKEVINYFHFSLRDLAIYYRKCKTSVYKKAHDYCSFKIEDGAENGLYVLVPIIIGLEIYDYSKYQSFISGKDSSPLINILGNGEILNFFFCGLLFDNETYDDDKTDKTIVTREQKLKEYYNAVFVEKYSVGNIKKRIGIITCDKDTKNTILHAASGLRGFEDQRLTYERHNE